jgi:hypothetical protein
MVSTGGYVAMIICGQALAMIASSRFNTARFHGE